MFSSCFSTAVVSPDLTDQPVVVIVFPGTGRRRESSGQAGCVLLLRFAVSTFWQVPPQTFCGVLNLAPASLRAQAVIYGAFHLRGSLRGRLQLALIPPPPAVISAFAATVRAYGCRYLAQARCQKRRPAHMEPGCFPLVLTTPA